MLPYIWFIDSYSLMIFIGIVACIIFVEIYFRRQKKYPPRATTGIELIGIAAIIIGFVGSNLMQNLYDFIENPNTFSYSSAYTFYGGLIFGVGSFLLGYYLFLRRRFPGLINDIVIIAPSAIAVAHGFGRIGCFLHGCCYGLETSSWYGMYFPSLGQTVIPTNLYEAIFLLALSAILLLRALSKKTFFNLPIYLISYGAFRFIIEFLRGDPRGALVPLLSPSQFWALVSILSGLIIIFYLKRNILFRHKSLS